MSISKGIFPKQFKEAKITPIHKKGPTQDVSNYRPISILPVLSKILEKHVALNLRNFLEDKKLLHENQSGFRSDHSCETALLNIVDNWINALNNNETVGTLFLDLSKAFDLVNHTILLQKLKLYKVEGHALKWFSSYLSGRSQKVCVNGNLSDPQNITAGVPQGSVLGPLLFIIYINDLPQYSHDKTQVDMFADDTTLSTHSTNKQDIYNNLQSSLDAINTWCEDNSMILNAAKTTSLCMSASNRKTHMEFENCSLNNQQIKHSSWEKLLGVSIDKNLTFQTHIDNILKKCNSQLYLLTRIKCFLNLDSRKMFYNAYILPHIDYCCTVWGSNTIKYLDKILKFQKRAARLILDKSLDTPSADLFKQLRWMTIYERIDYKKSVFMFKSINGGSPQYLSSKFNNTNPAQRQLRSHANQLLYLPQPRLEIFRRGISYAGPKLCNALPLEIRTASSLSSFKNKYIKLKFPDWPLTGN